MNESWREKLLSLTLKCGGKGENNTAAGVLQLQSESLARKPQKMVGGSESPVPGGMPAGAAVN